MGCMVSINVYPDSCLCNIFLSHWQESDDDLETSLEDPDEEYEGNKDAARALLRVKQKLDGYEEGEMRSVHGQVIFPHASTWILLE